MSNGLIIVEVAPDGTTVTRLLSDSAELEAAQRPLLERIEPAIECVRRLAAPVEAAGR